MAQHRRAAAITVALTLCCAGTAGAAQSAQPSFDCSRVEAGSIAKLVCDDDELTALDRRLAQAYGSALGRSRGQGSRELTATQRGWVKGRDDCWKAQDDRRSCVREAYVARIVELQARYRMVKSIGPIAFACNGKPADEVVVTYFQTEPRSLIARRGDQSSLMVAQPAASGTHYVGRNESLREHQGELKLVWGYGQPEMPCARKKP